MFIFILRFLHCRNRLTSVTSLSRWDPDLEPQDAAIFERMLKDEVEKANNDIAKYNELKTDAEFAEDVDQARDNTLYAYEKMLIDPTAPVAQIDEVSQAYEAYANAARNLKLARKSESEAEKEKQRADVLIAKVLRRQNHMR